MPTYAITGATGQLGRLTIQERLARDVPAGHVVAVVRTREKAADLADRSVQVREADYAGEQALAAALDGVNRLLLISSREGGRRVAQHTNVIDAAKTAGRPASSPRASSTPMTRPTRWRANIKKPSGR